MMIRTVLKNIFYYWRKTAITIFLAGIILFLGISSTIFTTYIKELVDRPLKSLQTEIILQEDSSNKSPGNVKTTGIILPFNLGSFSKDQALEQISKIPGVDKISTALVLWQFDIKNNQTLIALDVSEPKVGLRNIESMLMPGSSFFTGNDSPEIILERHFAALYKYKVGQDYKVGKNVFKIVGLVDFQQQSNLANAQGFLPYQTALKLIGEKDNIVNQVFISLKSASDLPKVKEELTKLYPSYSIVSKDSLLKNLSGLSQMFYRFGTYFSIIMAVISLALAFSVLRLHQLEYTYQTEILKILGWPKRKIRQWVVIDALFVLTCALLFACILALLLQWQIPSIIKSAPAINYNIKL
ncbi:MAG: ABC transporter permease [Actinobacteria bacterium]|nr:ABC transporter permease [Actinomycetota bacterium]